MDSNDWIVFAILVGSIGTMLFTGLNVLVFYMLKAYKLYRKANDLIFKMFDDMVDIPSSVSVLCIATSVFHNG